MLVALSISGCDTITSCTTCPQSAELTAPHPALEPGLMTPLPHSLPPDPARMGSVWPMSGHQAPRLHPPFPSSSFISASPGCNPMGLPGPLSLLNGLPAPPSPPSLTTGLACLSRASFCVAYCLLAVCARCLPRQVLGQLTYSAAPLWPGPIGCCTEIIAFDTHIIIIPFPEEEGRLREIGCPCPGLTVS